MEGIEKIKAKILEDAQNEADTIINSAKQEAERILAEAHKAAERESRDVLAKADAEAGEARRKIMAMAELDMRKGLLAVKQEMVDAAFDAALRHLKSLEDEEFEKVIGAMLEKAVVTGAEEIIVSPEDSRRFTPEFLEKVNQQLTRRRGEKAMLKLSGETRNISGGFILKGEGLEINNSFDAIIRMERDEIESEIARILFEE